VYDIIFSKQSKKFITSLKQGYVSKMKEIFIAMAQNPFSHPYSKIKGEQNQYRIRVGKYRILYEVDQDKKIIMVLKIDDRGHIYKP